MDNESLKDIPGYEGRYGITQDGKIWSYVSNKYLSQTKNKYGYYRVQLYTGDGKKSVKQFLVHRLVALTYVPNPDNLPTVDHIDRNTENNSVSNLRWASTYTQNHNQKEPCGIAAGRAISRAVEQRDKDNHNILIATYPSSMAAARELFNDPSKNSLINRCANGKKNSAYGYWWKFKE